MSKNDYSRGIANRTMEAEIELKIQHSELMKAQARLVNAQAEEVEDRIKAQRTFKQARKV